MESNDPEAPWGRSIGTVPQWVRVLNSHMRQMFRAFVLNLSVFFGLAVGFFGSGGRISFWKFASRGWEHPKAPPAATGRAAPQGGAASWGSVVPVGPESPP